VGIDFAAEGLLDGLEGDARAARLELLAQLERDGVGLADLHAAHADGRLVFLQGERVLGEELRFSIRHVADRTGLRPEFVLALRRAQALPAPGLDAVICTDGDVEAARLARRFLDAGIDEQQQLDVVSVLGRGLAQAAEAMRTTVLELVLAPGTSEAELARRYAAAVTELMPMVAPMLEQLARLHLRHLVRTEAVTAAERATGTLPGAREMAVCFADLVGFTRLGEEVAPDELGRVAHRLVEMATERVSDEVRLVKTIGDAAMLVAPEAPALVEVALGLVEAADAEGESFPQLRAGVAAGAALSRAGDWYGRPVNLASRITALARPGSVLATREVRDAAPEAYRWSPAGARSLKGIGERVSLYRPRRLATG
jgi:adenylate cyclase